MAARFSVEVEGLPNGLTPHDVSAALWVGVPGGLSVPSEHVAICSTGKVLVRIDAVSFVDIINRLSEQCGGVLKLKCLSGDSPSGGTNPFPDVRRSV